MAKGNGPGKIDSFVRNKMAEEDIIYLKEYNAYLEARVEELTRYLNSVSGFDPERTTLAIVPSFDPISRRKSNIRPSSFIQGDGD